MDEDLLVRDFTDIDQQAVNRVASLAWSQYAGAFRDWELLAASVANTAALAPQARLLVAERAHAIVGVVGYVAPGQPREAMFPGDWSIIRMLSVLPSERGRGIGRALVQACIDCARHGGVSIIGLHTTPVMRSALDLYLRMGFAFHRTIPDRFGLPYAIYTLNLHRS